MANIPRSAEVTRRKWWAAIGIFVFAGLAGASLIPMTFQDFHLSGTQIGDVKPGVLRPAEFCSNCHGFFDPVNDPYATWNGSLMAQAGRDPLFFAQMTTANQDVGNVGYYCMRCHVPMSFVTGHAYDASGESLDLTDRDGVTCHFCHSMLDPIYKPGVSPPIDADILAGMPEVPAHYGNAMFVLDPLGVRRGPRTDSLQYHEVLPSPFHRTGEFCGTCHDVGNVAASKQPDGTYAYNAIDTPPPDEDPHAQFPLERTYTEWKLSAFANGGVDMGGRFGGQGVSVVSTCQDCHMPKTTGQACVVGPVRSDLAKHDFAGASSWVLEIIGLFYQGNGEVDQDALLVGRQKAISMVQRSASLELEQGCGAVRVRVINETGHKLPTGHIEGRRVWTNVVFRDAGGQILREYGHYDYSTAELDEQSTDVYEMKIGLSETAAAITGYPPGETTHMSLADIIVKDNRIPPRGFNNAAYEAGGAPAVAAVYADGQYWDDTNRWIPDGAVQAEVGVYYQTVTRHYIEALRDGNVTDNWGQTLYQLWLNSNKGAPVNIVSNALALTAFVRGDSDGDTDVDLHDHSHYVECAAGPDSAAGEGCECMDFEGDGDVDLVDFAAFQVASGQ